MGKEFCGTIEFQQKKYYVYLDQKDKLIYVSEESIKNEFSHFNKFKAENIEEALELAPQMLETAFGNR